MNDENIALQDRLRSLAPWYFLARITDGVYTVPPENWDARKHTISHQHFIARQLAAVFEQFGIRPAEVSMLDVGCNCGWLSFMLARSGCRKVVGYDVYPKFIEQANLIREYNPLEGLSFTDDLDTLPAGETFDVTLALGVLNHVDDPVSFLERLRDMTGRMLVLDCNCFVPGAQGKPFDCGEHAVSEALCGSNFVPRFDGEEGYTFEMQHTRQSVRNLLYRAGFSPVFELAAPLSQPVAHGYYHNRFFAVAVRQPSPDSWQEELRWRLRYEKDAPASYVNDDFFAMPGGRGESE